MFRTIIILVCLFLCACTGSDQERLNPISRIALSEPTKEITQIYLTEYSHLLLYDLSQVLDEQVLVNIEPQKKWVSVDYQGYTVNVQKWVEETSDDLIVMEYYSKTPVALTNDFTARIGTSYESPFQIMMSDSTITLQGTVFYTVQLEDSVLLLTVIYQNMRIHLNNAVDAFDIDGNLDFKVDFITTISPHNVETGNGTVHFSESSIRFDNEEKSFLSLDEGVSLFRSFLRDSDN